MTIRKRIVYGYGLVLGLAIAGTSAGLLLGNHYQQRALAMREVSIAERKLLSDLRVQILFNRPTKQISPYLNNPEQFEVESQNLLNRIDEIQSTLERGLDLHEEEEALHGDTPEEHEDLHELFENYETTLDEFRDRTESFIANVNAIFAAGGDVSLAQAQLIGLVQSPEFNKFVDFSDQLASFVDQIEGEEEEAKLALQQAEILRTALILGSLAVSALIATAIAWYTSQAISKPILAVTTVARRITDEKNFDLQAPVYGQDEVGILAQSLNQLIHQVNHLFAQLEQKNHDLKAALQQLNQQQMQLVQTEKMSSLGQLVAGVAHEINNPVNFIHGNLKHVKEYVDEVIDVIEMMRQRYPDAIAEIETDSEDLDLDFLQADLGKILDSMQVGTERIRQIVLSLRSFSRVDEAAYKPANIHDGIESSLMILQHRLKAKPDRPTITITREYGDLPQVDCFPGQLNQVVMNILANAIDAIESRYTNAGDARSQIPLEITVRTRCTENSQAEIVIADTGIGMDAETRDRMFEPFYTTKPVGVGTGLGMSISHQIVTEVHGGQLECKSAPGEGTEFIIRIPIHQIRDEAEVTAAIATTSA